ncbi:MAG: peptidoglycan-binding protein [Eubacteriales bacterium]|nr:peptidoglycan-binding protein [Eubacteriales bacterium]
MHGIFKRFIIITICLLFAVPVGYAFRYETLRPGERGQEIKNMQEALVFLQYPIKADGKYGPMTENAVRAFQMSQKLNSDGLAGHNTLTRLFLLAPQFKPQGGQTPPKTDVTNKPNIEPSYSNAVPNIGKGKYRQGDEANNVRLLQERLNTLGYDAGRADAVFGRKTTVALKEFQANAGLVVDGVAGQNTFNVLFSKNAPKASDKAPSPTKAPATYVPQPNATSIPATHAPLPSPSASPQTDAPVNPSPIGSAFVDTPNKGSLNFRRVPKKGAGFIKAIPNGTTVSVVTSLGSWCQIIYEGQKGYVMTEFLNFGKNTGATQAPVPTFAPVPTAPVPTSAPAPVKPDINLTSRPGDRNEQVRLLQEKLKELGYSVNVNSYYDSKTRAAVIEFQRKNGLKQDGLAGRRTKTLLYSTSATPNELDQSPIEAPSSFETLSIDDKGSAVELMQKRLKQLGYPVTVSKVFDMKTHQAVVAFQSLNKLSKTGRADASMQKLLFSNNAKRYSSDYAGLSEGAGRDISVSSSQVKLLHWFKDIKPSIRAGQTVTVYHPGSGINFKLRLYSLGRHADSEPLSLKDTTLMNRALGPASWNTRGVYVKLPNGTWTLASMHNYPHLSGAIKDNGFDGHLCVHFLRDMEEAEKNDPNYGVSNQKNIRKIWKSISGEELDY